MSTADPSLPVPGGDPLDEAASAVVDGVATPEEAALIAGAPDGPTRVATARAVATAVGSPVRAQDPRASAAALGAALAAFDADRAADHDEHAGVGTQAPARGSGRDGQDEAGTGSKPWPRVTRLPSARPGPRAGTRRLAAVAAALLLLVGLGAFAAAALRPEESETTFSAAPPAARDAAEPAAGPAPPISGGGEAAAPAPAPAAPETRAAAAARLEPPVVDGGDLGGQDRLEALTQRAAAALDGVPEAALAAPDAAPPTDVQTCATAATTGRPVGALRYRAVGTFRGTPAVFLAYDRPSGDRLLVVAARADCSVLTTASF